MTLEEKIDEILYSAFNFVEQVREERKDICTNVLTINIGYRNGNDDTHWCTLDNDDDYKITVKPMTIDTGRSIIRRMLDNTIVCNYIPAFTAADKIAVFFEIDDFVNTAWVSFVLDEDGEMTGYDGGEALICYDVSDHYIYKE
jgi:hypothetical protein